MVCGHLVFIFGGYDSNFVALASTSILNLKTGVCTEGPKVLVPRSYCMVVELDERHMLMIGGLWEQDPMYST